MSVDSGRLSAHEAYERALAVFDAAVSEIKSPVAWQTPTPCTDWDLRALVNHVVGEDRWVPPLLGGRSIADVGDALDGDLLGEDPLAAWRAACTDASAAAARTPNDQPVELSFGTVDVAEYLHQLAADHLVHAWDVASATGAPAPDDPLLVTAVSEWFDQREDLYRGAGAIGPRRPVADGASELSRLLSRFGRAPRIEEVVRDFGAAFNRHDLDVLMASVTDDIVFESTAPPDGERYVGAEAVRSCWAQFFASSTDAVFTEESLVALGSSAVVQWRYDWHGDDPGHVRGIDLIKVRDGRVCEKISYVKG